jgi:hypothetical protein
MGKSRVKEKRDHLGNLGIHGWLVDLTETGYDSRRHEPVLGSCEYGDEPLVSIKSDYFLNS